MDFLSGGFFPIFLRYMHVEQESMIQFLQIQAHKTPLLAKRKP